MAENNDLREEVEKRGTEFCRVLTRAQLEQMNKFISEYDQNKVEATRTLRSLDFLLTVAEKMRQ